MFMKMYYVAEVLDWFENISLFVGMMLHSQAMMGVSTHTHGWMQLMKFGFCPLTDEDDSQRVTTQKMKADRLVVLTQGGIIGEDEARRVLSDDPDSDLNFIVPDEVPPPPEGMGTGEFDEAVASGEGFEAATDEFKEENVKRDEDGKFATQDGGGRNNETLSVEEFHKQNRPKNLSVDEKNAIYWYGGGHFRDINKSLRNEQELTGLNKEIVDNLDSIFNRSKLNHETTVYKGVDPKTMEALKSQPSFVDKAFVSTSSDFDTAKGFSWGNGSGVLEIEIPKGAKAFSTIEHGSSSYENESLLNRNSSFKVTGNKIIDGKPVLQLKMIQEEDADDNV